MPKDQRDNKKTRFVSGERPDKRRKRLRVAIIAAVLVVVIAGASVGGWSYFNNKNKSYQEAAIRVNDVTFDMGYYIDMLKTYFGKVSSSDLSDYTSFGDIEIEQFAGYVQQEIVRNEVIKQGSAALGVEVDLNAIKTELKNSDTPTTEQQIDILRAKKLIEKQVPSVQPQAHVQAILTATEEEANQAIARLQNGEPLAQVAGDLSRISPTTILEGDLGWVTAREADLTVGSTNLGNAAFSAGTGLSSQPVYDDSVTKQYGFWVVQVTERQEATDTTPVAVHAKGILVSSVQEANGVIDQLKAGADIDELAAQVSQAGTAAYGAELGWITQGADTGEFNALFDLPINGISQPIGDDQSTTTGGYWVLNIVEKDNNRALTSSQENVLENDVMNQISAVLQEDPDFSVEVLMTPEMGIFAINEVVLAQGKGSVFITCSAVPEGEAGVPYSYQFETYGTQDGNSWSITSGSLPQGLTFDASAGMITGTPKFAGGSSFTIRVDNSYHYWEQEIFMRVRIPVSVVTETLPDAQIGVDYSVSLEAMGDGNDDYTWDLVSGSLPDGLNLGNLTGNIYGTANVTGTFEFTVQVADGLGTGNKTLSLTVVEELPAETPTPTPTETPTATPTETPTTPASSDNTTTPGSSDNTTAEAVSDNATTGTVSDNATATPSE